MRSGRPQAEQAWERRGQENEADIEDQRADHDMVGLHKLLYEGGAGVVVSSGRKPENMRVGTLFPVYRR